jgi:polysaccharide export outer membrane protein
MRLTDVIRSIDELEPGADLHYVMVRRELPPDRRISVISADLASALFSPESVANIELQPRDQITIFDLATGRDRVIQPVLDEMRLQSSLARPTQVVRVDGQVRIPGEYPLETAMTVRDLLRAGGGLMDAAYGSSAELTRYRVVNGEMRSTEVINIDLTAAIKGDPSSNLKLEPFDDLSVKQVQEWQAQASVDIVGEVRFPGSYAIKRGETLKSVMIRAGGLTDTAFPQGSVFTRRELKRREQEQIDILAKRTQRDLTILALQGAAANQAGAAGALSVGQSLLGQLRDAKAVGRLVIDLQRTINAPKGSPDDVILRDGDQLIIPKFQQQVTVMGEVQNTTSHLFSPGLSRDDYIALSGGTTRNADHKRIYVVRANGSVLAGTGGDRWFERSSVQIMPGDTIVVPLDATKLPALPLWTAVTQILYNVAIAVAAVHSL